MNEISIVTAFFDIGRGDYKGFERSAEQYLEYFRFWARLRNRMVVYTQKEYSDAIRQIRASFGLADKTDVIAIPDFRQMDAEVLEGVNRVMAVPQYGEFRGGEGVNNPECCKPLYNYIVYLKPFWVVDAIERGLTGQSVAWIDFGYNHGGEYYTNPKEFDFFGEFDLSGKMHLFLVNDLDDMPVFEIVRTLKTYVAGGIIVGCPEGWRSMKNSFAQSMRHLLACGLTDDDQILELMAYREAPDLFELHRIRHFFEPFQSLGAARLTCKSRRLFMRYVYKRLRTEARVALKKGEYAKWLRLTGAYLAAKITRRKEEA